MITTVTVNLDTAASYEEILVPLAQSAGTRIRLIFFSLDHPRGEAAATFVRPYLACALATTEKDRDPWIERSLLIGLLRMNSHGQDPVCLQRDNKFIVKLNIKS